MRPPILGPPTGMRVGRANGEDWLRLGEAAATLGVSPNTVRRWSDSGRLTCYRSPGGHRRYRRRDVESLLRLEDTGPAATPTTPDTPPELPAPEELRAPLTALARVAAEGVGVELCRISIARPGREDGALTVSSRSAPGRATVADEEEALPAVTEVLRTGRRLVIADLAATTLLTRDDAEAHRARGDQAVLAVPLDVAGGPGGVMQLVETRTPRSFDGANIAFAEFMARQAAHLIAGEDAPPRRPPDVPLRAAATTMDPPTDGGALLRTIVERLRGELDAVACDVFRYDAATEELTLVAAAVIGKTATVEGFRSAAADLGDAARALTVDGPVAIHDLRGSRPSGTHLMRLEQSGACSLHATAIRLGRDVVGLLEVFSSDPWREFDREELGLLEAGAATAALAISDDDAAGLSHRASRFDDLIAGIGMRTPASDAEVLVRSALRTLRERAGVAACTLYRVDEGVATPLADEDDVAAPVDGGAPWRLEEYPAAAAAVASGAPAVCGSTGAERPAPEAAARFLEARGLAGTVLAPVVFWDELVGILELGTAEAGGLLAATQMARVTADLLAVVLGSGDVISRLQRRNRDLSLVIEAGLEDTARLSRDEVLHAVVERLSDLTHSPVADIYAVEGPTLRALVSYDGGRFDKEWEGVVLPLPRYPCSRRAVETGEIAVTASLADPLLGVDGQYSLEKWGYQSQLSMPLLSGGRVIGLVELSDYRPRDFASDLDLIRGLGQVAGHALENASLFEQVNRRSRILNELVELGTLTSGSRDLGAVLPGVAERLLTALDAANCDIYRVSEEGLRCVASFDRSGLDETAIGTLLDLDSYPTLAAAMNGHQVLVVASPDDPQLSEQERRTYREYGFASEVSIPLVVNDELYGMLDIYDTRERDYGEYLSFLRSAAQTLAGAFENALLFDQLEHRSGVLRDVVELGAVASQTHDLGEVLAALAARLRDTVGAADCDIFTLQGDTLRCLVSADTDGLDTGVVGHVLDMDRFPATAMAVRSGQAMAVTSLDDPRLTDEEREDMGEYGFQSELCIPLVGGERVIGLIDIFDTRPRDYGEYMDFLRSVGQTAAGAIENAMLFDELERHNAALAELVELGKTVSGAGGLTELVRSIGPRIVDLMDADGCQVFILRGDKLHCVLTYDHGEFDDDYADRPLDLESFPSTRDAIGQLAALVIESPDDPRLSDYERELYLESGSQSEICVPLVLNDRVVGLLDVFDHRRRDYAEHRDFLLRVGQIVAGAFENALLVERLEESNQTLGLLVESGIEFGATLDLDEVLRRVAGRLCAATAAPNCDIFTLHGETLRCVCSVEHGVPDPDYVGAEYPLTELGLAGMALESRQPLVAGDLAIDPRVSEFERQEDLGWGHRAVLDLPLISRGEVIGLAGLYDDHPRDFERLDFLHSLAQVAASALANATLFDRLDRSAERMQLVSEVSLELSSSLDLHEILLSTARRLCAILQMPMCDIYTLRDDAWLDNVASIDDGEIDEAWQGRSFALSDWGALHVAVESRQPVVVESRDDPLLQPAEIAAMAAAGETGGLIVPLIAKERVMGVVELSHRGTPRQVSDEETATIVSICRFAALAIDNAELYQGIKTMHLSNLKALSSALNAKDYYTLGHAARVAAYMVLLGKELGWPDDLLRHIEEAAYLHDIGKIGVSDRVLLKSSGLNAHEWELMRQHPIFSADIIRPLFDEELVAGVRHHHERWAGDGYPDGLAGEEIPLIARAMCVADSYDAMSFRRPYRQGLTYAECLEELDRCRGEQFDPEMVDAFRRVLGRIADGRRFAAEVARQAAAAIDAGTISVLRDRDDERRPEYAAVVRTLREVSAANPPTRFLSAFARRGRKTVVLADSGPDSPEKPHLGDEVVTDDELAEVFAGGTLPANVLFVDQWGVWISGVAPLTDPDGHVDAVVSADIPATAGSTEVEGLRSNVAQTFASMVNSATLQTSRSELEAITDGLTGLYNHRYFHERLSEEMERCQEQGTSLALLFCDLDNFRVFNELHGHGSGDRALRVVARVLENSVRHVDLAARYGGEEFAAILIDTTEEGALDVAERIRSGILKTQFAAGTDTLSVSIGVATSPKDATFKDELVDKADWAMYLAKRRGRNKVMTFGAEHGGETPEQAALVGADHVAVMGELVAAREAYRQRRRSAIAQLALGVGREIGLPAEELHAAVTEAESGTREPDSRARQVVALATAYQELVTERPYRARISEAEALDETLRYPALADDPELTRAFERVLARRA